MANVKSNTAHDRKNTFYVFYDYKDFVKCCGTPQELVDAGFYKSVQSVQQIACKIKNNKIPGNVVILPL